MAQRGTGRRGRVPARTVRVAVRVDAALKRMWKEASARLERCLRSGANAFDETWETVGEILEHEPPLYLAGGFGSAEAFVRAVLKEPPRTALRYVRVAKLATAKEEERYGVSKLDAVLSYVEAKMGGPPRGRVPIAFSKLRVAVEGKDGRRRLKVEQASVPQIRAATRKLLRGAGTMTTKAPPVVRAIAAALRGSALRGVTVRLARGEVTLGAIPVQAIGALARALAGVKVPAANGAGRG